MSNYKDFSSLPPDKEQHFVIFEKTSVETLAKAKKIAAIVAGVFGLIVCVIVLSFDKPKNLMEDDDMGQLSKSKSSDDKAAETPAPKPDKPATEEKTPEPAAGGDAEGGDAEGGDAKGGDAKEGDEAGDSDKSE